MLRSKKSILAVIIATFWSALIVLLCLVIPYLALLEIFLVALGSLVIVSVGILVAREVSKLIDLLHAQQIWRERRELDLLERKQGQLLLTIKRKRSLRDRYS